jgi:hypothetical protein
MRSYRIGYEKLTYWIGSAAQRIMSQPSYPKVSEFLSLLWCKPKRLVDRSFVSFGEAVAIVTNDFNPAI